MKLSIIAAMSKNRVIGKDNKIPWHIPKDLKYFKEKTIKKPIIMGRKTYESIGKLLPNRTNIIVTRKKTYKRKQRKIDKNFNAIIVNDIFEAIGEAILAFGSLENDLDEAMVIGGAEIYKEILPYADRIYLTIIDSEIDGDTFFPELGDDWKIINTERVDGDPSFSFNVFERVI